MERFEYKVIKRKSFDEDELNELGRDGWELVCTSIDPAMFYKIEAVLKRRIDWTSKRKQDGN